MMQSEELLMGWAVEDITPPGPAVLFGQYYDRLSGYVESPLTATACALESAGGQEQAILLSIDLIWCPAALIAALRQILHSRIPGFNSQYLLVHATHTHSAPEPDVHSAYGQHLLEKLAAAAVSAWQQRQPASVGRALAYAVAGHNRRVRYADGTAEMYGATDRPDFTGLEGPSDSAVDLLFCWNDAGALTGIIMNVPCPAQVTEAKYYVSADFWSVVKKRLQDHFGQDVQLLAQCGAAGDISPRNLLRPYTPDEPNMWDLPGMVEVGERLARAAIAAYADAEKNRQNQPVFKHRSVTLQIPYRTVSPRNMKPRKPWWRTSVPASPSIPHPPAPLSTASSLISNPTKPPGNTAPGIIKRAITAYSANRKSFSNNIPATAKSRFTRPPCTYCASATR
ncbi:hypothetical protein WJU16_06495 [Chitinophaga pollutisoli]|uniref:Neutral/alkaline ceramidase-like enzyme n=1 Tax=Chitinophaga pollutisoli TaxID=3133966 RepID=A0ABZ2YTP5_9BACT